jgi:hypothetical protein
VDLELEPIEGERVISEEEQERRRYRTRSITPEELARFNTVEQAACRDFLVRLIVLTEQFQHDLDQHDPSEACQEHIRCLNEKRRALFIDPPGWRKDFIALLELYPMEPWAEFSILIQRLQSEDRKQHYAVISETGIEAAFDNPFLMQQEDASDDSRSALAGQARITPAEIEALLSRYPLCKLVNHLTSARRVSTGGFWEEEYYDL